MNPLMKSRSALPWEKGLAIGFIVSFTVSSILTYLDWQTNPSGIFHSPQGTDCNIVWETLISWLWPLLVLTIPLFMLVGFLIAHIKK